MPAATQNARRIRWKSLRIAVQVTAVLLFVVHFFALVYPYQARWPADTPFLLDPLTHIYLALTGNGIPHWIWALASLVLLYLLARVFCGWLCPLGALLDFTTSIKRWLSNKPPVIHRRNILPANFNIYLLVALVVLAILGAPLLWLLDPIVFSIKFLTVAVLPVIDTPLRASFETLDNWFYQSDWWWPIQDGYQELFSVYQRPTYTDTTLFLAFAATIIGLELWQPRFWCRYICPLGALNRLVWFIHPLRRRLTAKCTFCLECDKVCHFGSTTDADCTFCMECIDGCKFKALTFLPQNDAVQYIDRLKEHNLAGPLAKVREQVGHVAIGKRKDTDTLPSPDTKLAFQARLSGDLPQAGLSRRNLLKFAVGGAVAYPAVRLLDNRVELPVDFLRPPGVLQAAETPEAAEARFVELCIKCGQCLKACPTNGLQPSLLEAGLSALWSPRLIPRLGECEYNCTLCGQACPTGAIPRLELVAKQQAWIGVAYIDKNRCIPWDINSNCTVCEEHCPVGDKAIQLDGRVRTDENGNSLELLRPYIIPELCTGCGICERVCPVPGLAAVRVFRRPPGEAYGGAADAVDDVSNAGMAGYGDYPSDDF